MVDRVRDGEQVSLTADEARDLMRELDRDGDGSIIYKEFIRFLNTTERPARGGRAPTPIRRDSAPEQSPDAIKAGLITRVEARTLTSRCCFRVSVSSYYFVGAVLVVSWR